MARRFVLAATQGQTMTLRELEQIARALEHAAPNAAGAALKRELEDARSVVDQLRAQAVEAGWPKGDT